LISKGRPPNSIPRVFSLNKDGEKAYFSNTDVFKTPKREDTVLTIVLYFAGALLWDVTASGLGKFLPD